MHIKNLIKAAFLAVGIASAAPAAFANADNYRKAFNAFADGDNEKTVQYTTDAINQGQLTDAQLANMYNSRGSAYNFLRLDAMEAGDESKEKQYTKSAFSDFDSAIELDPGNFSPFYNRGILHKFTNQYRKAISDLEKAYSLWENTDPSEAMENVSGNAKAMAAMKGVAFKQFGFNINKQLESSRILLEAETTGPKLPSFIPKFDRAAPGADLIEKGWLANWERQNERAMDYFEEAANLGNADAMSFLAMGYRIEHGRPKSIEKWKSLMEQSIAAGRVYGYFEMALAYRSGDRITKDVDEAMRLLKNASAEGIQEADLYIAYNYIYGLGVEKDPQKGHQMIEDLAKSGYDGAQWTVGLRYYSGYDPENGNFYEKDLRKSAKWLRKAAKQGNVKAQVGLAEAYLNGKGVLQDYKKAFRWTEQAALQGDPSAQYNLGVYYWNGQGTNKDRNKSKVWWEKASAWGNDAAAKALTSVR